MAFLTFLKFLKLKLRRKRLAKTFVALDIAETDNIKKSNGFYWEDLHKLTMNLSFVIGYGGFSTVYLARFPDSSTAAVKIQCSSERLNLAHKQELEILLHLHHPYIVKLLGHCHDREDGILVLEYVPNGNLQEKLHGSKNDDVLPWKKRVAIAFQLAQAIEYLHKKCRLQIIHGDIKASNVLLDENLDCKLCDFGSAKMGFSSLVLPPSDSPMRRNRIVMTGSPGYTDPQYFRTGLASKENDVYSFGVIVLELVTGVQASNPVTGERLTTRAEPMMRDVEKVVGMVDPRLRGEFDFEEAKAMVGLAALCLSESPIRRPCVSEVLSIMRKKISSVSCV